MSHVQCTVHVPILPLAAIHHAPGIDWKVDQEMLPVKTPTQDRDINLQHASFESFFDLQHANTVRCML